MRRLLALDSGSAAALLGAVLFVLLAGGTCVTVMLRRELRRHERGCHCFAIPRPRLRLARWPS